MSLWDIYKAKKLGINSELSFDALVGRKLKDISEWVTDSVPYISRLAFSEANTGAECMDQIVGGSIVWNQLVQTSDTSVTVPSGHKYLSKVNNVQTVSASDGTAISINDGTKDNVHDLTLMFGTMIADYINSLETATAGAGVAYFRSMFPKLFYAYNAGTLISVKTSGHKTTGKNALDDTVRCQGGTTRVAFASSESVHPTHLLAGTYTFSAKFTSGLTAYLYYQKSGGSNKDSGKISNSVTRTITLEEGDYRFWFYRSGGLTVDDVTHAQLELGSTATDYEQYALHSYELDDIELRGIPKLISEKLSYDGDTYDSNGVVTRKFGVRAYKDGDVTDGETMITDGTNTIYKLSARITETTDPFTNPQAFSKYGTEAYVVTEQSGVAMPVGHQTKYKLV